MYHDKKANLTHTWSSSQASVQIEKPKKMLDCSQLQKQLNQNCFRTVGIVSDINLRNQIIMALSPIIGVFKFEMFIWRPKECLEYIKTRHSSKLIFLFLFVWYIVTIIRSCDNHYMKHDYVTQVAMMMVRLHEKYARSSTRSTTSHNCRGEDRGCHDVCQTKRNEGHR